MIAVFAPAPVRVADVLAAVATEFGVTRGELIGDRRARAIARPRQVAYLLARELTPQSLPAIGRSFGDRDHSTIIAGIRSLQRWADGETRATIGRVRDRARGLAAARAGDALPREPRQLGLHLVDAAEPELAL